MTQKMYLKSSCAGIRVILVAGFFTVGSYAQDSLGVPAVSDALQKNAGQATTGDQGAAQAGSTVTKKPTVNEPAAAKVAVEPVPAKSVLAKDRKTASAPQTEKSKGEKVLEPEQEFKVGYVPIKDDNKSSLKSEDISKNTSDNLIKSLQGRFPGVNITTTARANRAKTINIRGVGTIHDNNPLYILDGVEVKNIDNLNPNDIASIEVLKDVSETAMYGSRGANGVIVVTTKTAK